MTDILAERVVELQSGDTPVPFFFFPPMSGGTGSYTLLINLFGSDQTCFGFHSRGLRDLSVQPALTIQEMADDYLEDLLRIQPDGPYYLIGWSLGALTALEVGRRLKEQGKKIGFVGSVDLYFKSRNLFQDLLAPENSNVLKNSETVFLYQLLSQNLTYEFYMNYMQTFDPDDRLKYLGEECRRVGYFRYANSIEEIVHILRIVRANMNAAMIYEPNTDAIPVVYTLASKQMPILGHSAPLDYINNIRPHPTIQVIHGADHGSIITQPFVAQVAKFLRIQRDASFRKHRLASRL